MALPDSRNTTYIPGSQVKSADLNDIQDQIIALDDWLTGARAEGVAIDGSLTLTNSLIAAGTVVAGGNVSAALDVVAIGDVKYSTPRPRWTHAVAGAGDPAKWHLNPGALIDDVMVRNLATGALTPWVVALIIEEGETIESWGVRMDNTDGVGVLRVELSRQGASGAPVNVGAVTRAAGAGLGLVTETLNHLVQPGAYIAVAFTTANASSVGTLGIGAIRLTVKRVP